MKHLPRHMLEREVSLCLTRLSQDLACHEELAESPSFEYHLLLRARCVSLGDIYQSPALNMMPWPTWTPFLHTPKTES